MKSSSLRSSPRQSPRGDSSHQFSIWGLPTTVIAVVASIAWMAVSSGLIMLNKSLLSGGFPYPMALSGLGMGFSGLASYITIHHFKLVQVSRSMSVDFWMRRILPIGLLMALTLAFGNLVYLYLTVAFIQMLKSFTPIVTMIALFAFNLEYPSKKLVTSVVFIGIGTAVSTAGEVNFSLLGIAIMFLSETFEALRLVGTQILLTGLKFHPVEGLMHLAPACFMWLMVGSIAMEAKSMITNNALAMVGAKPLHFMGAAAMGFAVNLLAYIVIQTASSLTLKVLGTVKNVVVVLLGVFVLSEKVTALEALGYCVSILAFYWYQKIKLDQIRSELDPNATVDNMEKGSSEKASEDTTARSSSTAKKSSASLRSASSESQLLLLSQDQRGDRVVPIERR